jgi:hypothetical protein
MTRDDDWDGVKSHNNTLAAVRLAVAAERERCATIAESFMTARGRTESEGGFIARRIADVIRGGPVQTVTTGDRRDG